MNFIKAYKFPLGITLGLIAIFFIFQNGTCGGASTATGDSATTTSTGTTTSVASSITLSPANTTVALGGTVQFSASGGSGNYSFTKVAGVGSITSTGLYTAPSTSGSAEIAAEDLSSGTYGYAVLSVGANGTSTTSVVTMSATSLTVGTSGTIQLTATGGTAPYTFLVLSGGGGFPSASAGSSSTGTITYTAPSSSGTVQVEAIDSLSNVSTVTTLVVSTSTVTTPGKFISALTNVPNGQSQFNVSNLIDGDPGTCFSSSLFTTTTPTGKPYVQLSLGDKVTGAPGVFTLTHLYITARGGSAATAFPASYTIQSLNGDNSGWTVIGTYSTQPDFDGIARIVFSAPVSTSKIVIIGNTLTRDPKDIYFQFCEVSM